jgi:hypothetical protein
LPAVDAGERSSQSVPSDDDNDVEDQRQVQPLRRPLGKDVEDDNTFVLHFADLSPGDPVETDDQLVKDDQLAKDEDEETRSEGDYDQSTESGSDRVRKIDQKDTQVAAAAAAGPAGDQEVLVLADDGVDDHPNDHVEDAAFEDYGLETTTLLTGTDNILLNTSLSLFT